MSSRLAQNSSGEREIARLFEVLARQYRLGGLEAAERVLVEHPDQAEELRQLLPTLDLLDGMSRSGGTASRCKEIGSPLEFNGSAGVLGDFRIVREIGRGGMGIVYEAQQISLNRRVAIKVLPFAAVLDPNQLRRFQNEAQAAAGLHHTHIVPVYSVGCERGIHYYAMQYIDGVTVAQFIAAMRRSLRRVSTVSDADGGSPDASEMPVNREALPTTRLKSDVPEVESKDFQAGMVGGDRKPTDRRGIAKALPETGLLGAFSTEHKRENQVFFRRIAELGVQIAEALDYAHQQAIVHRDIKPANLLIDVRGKVWIADFGLARVGNEANLTVTGDLVGTLRYMSPEQVLATRPFLDHRTDIYSLGITLYELLTYEPAFPDMDRQVLLQQIPQGVTRSPRSIRPEVPADLETIVVKAIETEPAERYQTAAELADDLRRYLKDEPIRASRPTLVQRAVKWSRRHRMLVSSSIIAGSLSLLIAVVAAAIVLHARQQIELERIARQIDSNAARTAYENSRDHRYVTRINLADRAVRHGEMHEAERQLGDIKRDAFEYGPRGFEWGYLSQLSDYRGRELGRHRGAAYTVRPSPDGTWLVSAGQDGVRLWDPQTDELIRDFTVHTDEANSAALSADNRWLVTTSDDFTALIWDTRNWSIVARLRHTGQASGGRFTRDGKFLMTCERNEDIPNRGPVGENVVRIWETASWTQSAVIRGHNDRLTAADVSDDETTLVTADRQGVVHFWQLPGGSLLRTVRHNAETSEWTRVVRELDIAHRQPLMATCGIGPIHLWDTDDGSLVARLSADQTQNRCIAFSPDDAYLLAGGDEKGTTRGSVQIWERSLTGEYLKRASIKFPSIVWSMCFLGPDELASAGDDGVVWRWRLPGRSAERRFRADFTGGICHAAVSPDGRWLARSCPDLVVQSLEDLDRTITLDVGPVTDCPLTFSPDGKQLFVAQKQECKSWHTETWECSASLPYRTPDGRCRRLQFATRDELVAEGADGGIRRWTFSAGQATGEINDGPLQHKVTCLQCSETVTEAKPGILTLKVQDSVRWNRSFPKRSSINFSADGRCLAVANADGSVEIVDAATGVPSAVCIGARAPIRDLSFSRDGQTLVAHTGSDGRIMLWHVRSGRELLTIQPGFKIIRSLFITPDCRWLIVAGQGPTGHAEIAYFSGKADH